MDTFGSILKYLRLRANLTQQELAEKLGKSKSIISMYENDNRKPDYETLEEIADFFNVDMDKLMGRTEITLTPVTLYDVKADPKRIPIIGKIAAGVPITAIEEYDEWFDIDQSINADFALRVKGDSMINANIFDGDIAFFRAQNTLESGEIGVFVINDEATLKRYRVYDDFALLEPANPDYKAIVVNAEKQANIQGKLVGVYSEKKK